MISLQHPWAEVLMLLSLLFYFLMNGAQVFETAVLIPRWSAQPPQSLIVLKAPYGPDLKTFWIAMHSVHEVIFIAAIACCWSMPLRVELLVIFALHMAVRVWTILYFAPQIMAFQAMANTGEASANIEVLTSRWRKLNYLRAGMFLLLSLAQFAVYLKYF